MISFLVIGIVFVFLLDSTDQTPTLAYWRI